MKGKLLIISGLVLISFLSCVNRASEKGAEEAGTRSFELSEIWRTDTIMKTPESVIYDTKRNRYYVTNLNLEPRKKDGNGFISILTTDGKVENLRWIEGLSSPKGMAITGDTLIATDVDELVLMDINNGKIISKIPIEGAGMLNDITPGTGGNIYFSDTDAGKIHILKNGEVSEWMSGVGGPNGLLWHEAKLIVATQGSSEFFSVDMKSGEKNMLADSVGRGDGIAYTGIPGTYILTDWSGEIFLIQPGKRKTSLLRTMDSGINSADIEFLPEQKILLVPTFFGNNVVAYNLVARK